MPEPSWSRIGTTTVKDTATVQMTDGSVGEAGKIDLFVEVWEVENDSRSSENYIACTPRAGIFPGMAYSGGMNGIENHDTDIVQDWSANESGGYEITDWGPTTPKTASIDWSMSASYGVGGASGGVSASYNVPYIGRNIESEPNDTVAHNYGYPSSWWDPFDAEARGNFVEIESLGEGWIDDPSYWDTMLEVSLDHRFKGEQLIGTVTVPYFPSASTSVACSQYTL